MRKKGHTLTAILWDNCPMVGSNIKVLGIDPGSIKLGYAVVSGERRKPVLLDYGTLSVRNEGKFESRLLHISVFLNGLIELHKPDVLIVEKVFFAKNALSALKLGQVRGVILLKAAEAGIPIEEISPNEVKKNITGHGHADKDQVQKMIGLITGEKNFNFHDSSDAAAIALSFFMAFVPEKVLQPRPEEGLR